MAKMEKGKVKSTLKRRLGKIVLSPFVRTDEIRFLSQRVYSAAKNGIERTEFMAILHRAYENVMELEFLYKELPGVFRGDFKARRSFGNILNLATNFGRLTRGLVGRNSQRPIFPGSLPSARFPCPGPPSLIDPSKIMLIIDGIRILTQDNQFMYQRYIDGVISLWQKGRPLERINQLAREGVSFDGRDRLAEHMKIVASKGPIREYLGKEHQFLEEPYIGGPPNQDRFFNMPNPDGIWPPPSGLPGDFPLDDMGSFGQPFDPCERFQDICVDIIEHEARKFGDSGFYTVALGETYADGITSIDPIFACAGEIITIHGSGFGNSKPSNVNVLIGTMFAEVVTWSDTEIKIRVPEGAIKGCIGFIRTQSEREASEPVPYGSIRRSGILEYCTGVRLPLGGVIYYIPQVPCLNGNNLFRGSLPVINHFNIIGLYSSRVETPIDIHLSWSVYIPTASSTYTVEEDGTITPTEEQFVHIERVSDFGPNIDGDFPLEGTINLGTFDGPQGAKAVYEIGALNRCGIVKETVEVTYGPRPNLSITGIEVIQAIQRYDPTDMNAADNNSVELVARKRTIVRVFIDSGFSGVPFLQPNVTGALDLQIPGGLITEFRGLTPINAGGVVTARPSNQMDRNDLCHSLNFELPYGSLVGTVKITARVWEKDHQDDDLFRDRYNARGETSVFFHNRGERIVVRILVRDGVQNLAAPTIAQYSASLQGARTRFPIGENGFIVHIAPGFQTITTNHDLTTNDGWEDLLDDIDDIADDFVDWDQIWTALVPDNGILRPNPGGYRWAGMGIEGDDYPRLIAKTNRPCTFAHELAHTLGMDHADSSPCNRFPVGIDPDLPSETEDIGMDVRNRQLIPADTSELMSYCTPDWTGLMSCGASYPTATYQDRWPSIVLWRKLFNRLG